MTTRRYLLGCLTALAFTASATPAARAQDKPITIALYPFFQSWLFYGALEIGAVKVPGADLKIRKMFPGQLNQAMLAGETDAGEMSLGAYLIARSKGIPLVALATGIKNPGAASSVFVKADSGIKSPADLKGKKMGIIGFSSSSIINLRAILKHRYKIDDKEVTWVIKPLPQLPVLLEQGSVDAALLFADFYYRNARNPKLRDILNLGKEWKAMVGDDIVTGMIVMRKPVYEADPAAASALVAALRRSKEYGTKNVDQMVATYVKQKGGNPHILRAIAFDVLYEFSQTDKEKASIQKYIGYMVEQGLLKKPLDAKDLFVKVSAR